MGGIERRETEERASLGNEDLILSQMTGGGVVFSMCDTPRVEWNSETDGELMQPDGAKRPVGIIPGVEEPTDGVVNELGLGVGLVTAFVGNDPNTGGNETSPEGIKGPKRKFGGAVEDRVWELNNLRVDTGIEKSGSLIDSSQGSKIRDAGARMRQISRDSEQERKRRTRRARIAIHFA